MSDEAVPPPDDASPRHRRRRSRGPRSESRASKSVPLLRRLGRGLTRRAKLVACAGIALFALSMAVLVRHLESSESAHYHSVLSAVGFAPAIFITLLGVSTLVLAHAIGYKRKRLWLTTIILIVYLLLHAMAWNRAYQMAHDAYEPQIIGDIDNPNPTTPSTPAAIDSYVLGLYTIGTLSTISSFLLMRRLVRWSTPSRGARRDREGADLPDDGDATTAEGEDEAEDESDRGLPDPKNVELAALDAKPPRLVSAPESIDAARAEAASVGPAAEDDDASAARRRARRLFE